MHKGHPLGCAGSMSNTPPSPAMATSQSTALTHTLTTLFPTPWLHAQARALGVVIRQRKVDGSALFWVLVFGFGLGKARSVASLRRAYAAATGVGLSAAAFYERFTPALTSWLRAAVAEALQALASAGQPLPARLASFRDLVLADATVVRLHALLARTYPACRTNHTRAAAKLHVVLSVAGVSPQRVRLTSERVNERRVLRLGPWVAGRLLVMDLGYFKYALFARIAHYGGYFLSRLKASANPTIVAVHRRWRGQARAVVGQPLRQVLAHLQRAVLDVEVVVAVRRRWYCGRRRTGWQRFRVVAVRHPETGTYHVYLTNIPPTQLSAEDLRRTYAARWLVELLFKELKSTYQLDALPSGRQPVVETLLYTAILALLVSRALWRVVQQWVAPTGRRVPPSRWAQVLRVATHDLLRHVLRAAGVPPPPEDLFAWLRREALDPNRSRRLLLDHLEA